MKKFSVLIALVLLAVAGTGYAVTCAYDNVPAATLLVPYCKVSLNGATGAFPIPTGGTDTLVSIVNVSTPGVIAHVTVWNKYSKAVIDFNLPLTGKDVVSFSMRDIMNGRLSPNFPQCDLNLPRRRRSGEVPAAKTYPVDPCGLKNPGLPTATYVPNVGFGQTQFIRFSHPDAADLGVDVLTSISQYNLTACRRHRSGLPRHRLELARRVRRHHVVHEPRLRGRRTSSTRTTRLAAGPPPTRWRGALSGYLTIDVVNYCTNFFPDQADFYNKDAIATAGWTQTAYPDFPCVDGTVRRHVHAERPDRRRVLR